MTFPAHDLAGGGTRLRVIPQLGGKIASMVMAGREWLWKSDVLPYRVPEDGTSYVRTADTGGYDECFPTVGACDVPIDVPHWAGLQLPDHGELWAHCPGIDTGTDAGGEWLTAHWTGRRMPYHFTRRVQVGADGVVRMRYAVRNTGHDHIPFIWSSHPLLPLTPETRILLPEGARTRVYAEHGIALGGPGAEHRWPLLGAGVRRIDLSRPDAVGAHYACKLFLDMPEGRAAVEEGDARLEVRFDVAEVPHFGLWLNRRGWTPFDGGAPYLNFAFEPCIGAPDTLSDALGGWKAAQWLEGGEERTWALEWRGTNDEVRGTR
jgi:hypothetical protein